jgi:hypothetical protein
VAPVDHAHRGAVHPEHSLRDASCLSLLEAPVVVRVLCAPPEATPCCSTATQGPLPWARSAAAQQLAATPPWWRAGVRRGHRHPGGRRAAELCLRAHRALHARRPRRARPAGEGRARVACGGRQLHGDVGGLVPGAARLQAGAYGTGGLQGNTGGGSCRVARGGCQLQAAHGGRPFQAGRGGNGSGARQAAGVSARMVH